MTVWVRVSKSGGAFIERFTSRTRAELPLSSAKGLLFRLPNQFFRRWQVSIVGTRSRRNASRDPKLGELFVIQNGKAR